MAAQRLPFLFIDKRIWSVPLRIGVTLRWRGGAGMRTFRHDAVLIVFAIIALIGAFVATSPVALSATPAPALTPTPAVPGATPTPARPPPTPTPIPTPSPTPTPSPSPTPPPLYIVTPDLGNNTSFTEPQLADALNSLVAAAGASPEPTSAAAVIASRLAPTLITTITTIDSKASLHFTLVPFDSAAKPVATSIPLPRTLTDVTLATTVRSLTLQAINGIPAPPSPLLPNRRYDLVILPDTDLNDQSGQQTGTTAFSGSSYLESRLRIDFLRWRINATTVSNYFSDLSGSSSVEMPTNFVNQVKRLCSIQPGLYLLRYSIAYSETQQAFFGTQQGYATIDAVLYHCPGGIWNPFDFPNPPIVNIDPRHYVAHYTFTIHRRNMTTNGQIFTAVMIALNAGLTGARNQFKYLYFLGRGPVVAGSFLQNPGPNAAVTEAVGESSRYMTCAAFIEIVSPLLDPDHKRPVFTGDNRDQQPCPTAKALFDAYSVETPNEQYGDSNPAGLPLISRPQPSPRPSPLSALRIPP